MVSKQFKISGLVSLSLKRQNVKNLIKTFMNTVCDHQLQVNMLYLTAASVRRQLPDTLTSLARPA